MTDQKFIRNFAIVAHVDHGKSTLADRILELTGTVEKRDMIEQILDSNPIERERGITIKLAPVRMIYKTKNLEPRAKNDANAKYILNLIDTPGHVDFSYEVSRSLAACEGVILVVDATAGIQAQTVAHMQMVKQRILKVIPVINKIDLPSAKPGKVADSLVNTFGLPREEIIEVSAKMGTNIDQVLDRIVEYIPAPDGNPSAPLRALVFSSVYDNHKGVIVFVKIADGQLNMTDNKRLLLQASKARFIPAEFGIFSPSMKVADSLSCGEVGYIATGFKDLTLARVGDTIGPVEASIIPLPGYMHPKPMVYLGLYPINNQDFPALRDSLDKLHLSDSSFDYKLRTQESLGKGFQCGFLGLLHAEIIKERLQNEYNLAVIATAPTVEYRMETKNNDIKLVCSPADFPDPSIIKSITEPIMYVTIYTLSTTVGKVLEYLASKRGSMINLEYLDNIAKFTYLVPLSEIILNFFDTLKSISSGYASLDYEFYEYQPADAVKLDIYLNQEPIEALSQITIRSNSLPLAKSLVEKLKLLIPRHQFQIPVQAAIGGKIIARADIKSFRKDVTKKLYGGDRTRKDKLLEAQNKGKKRMKQFGKVQIPQEVFLEVYKSD